MHIVACAVHRTTCPASTRTARLALAFDAARFYACLLKTLFFGSVCCCYTCAFYRVGRIPWGDATRLQEETLANVGKHRRSALPELPAQPPLHACVGVVFVCAAAWFSSFLAWLLLNTHSAGHHRAAFNGTRASYASHGPQPVPCPPRVILFPTRCMGLGQRIQDTDGVDARLRALGEYSTWLT